MTESQRKRAIAIAMSSVMPSAKRSCAGLSLKFRNGSTDIEGPSLTACNGTAVVAWSVRLTPATKRYPRPGTVWMQLPIPGVLSSARRNTEICFVRLLSSTEIPGQTPAMRSPFDTNRVPLTSQQQQEIERARAKRDRHGPSCWSQAEEPPPIKLEAIEEKVHERFIGTHTALHRALLGGWQHNTVAPAALPGETAVSPIRKSSEVFITGRVH